MGGGGWPIDNYIIHEVTVNFFFLSEVKSEGEKSLVKFFTLGEAQVLGKLFPSSSSASSSMKRSFDPKAGCCVAEAQKKKKAANSQGRPTCIQVVMLKKFACNLPRGRYRADLIKLGRIKSIEFRRTMTSMQITHQIIQGFKEINVRSWDVLEAVNNTLSLAKNRSLDGQEVINRKGSLYLCQKAVAKVYPGCTACQGVRS